MKKTIIFLLILILIAVIVLIIMTGKQSPSEEDTLPTEEIEETMQEEQPEEATEETTPEPSQEATEETSLLDIPLTEDGVRAAIDGWQQTSLGSGGFFYSPPGYAVTEHENGLFEINKPGVTESFIAIGNTTTMQSYYGTTPTICYGGDVETGICLYGDNAEIEHVIKIMTYFQ